jgi:transposase InsO family protein
VFVMVAIEHFSKHVELVPLPNKLAATTAAAFAQHVLGRFGSCAEVVTDRGTEWDAEFDTLLKDSMIDHRHTSAYHPQADGLAERAVQTLKRALRKMCEAKKSKQDWDLQLPWVGLQVQPTGLHWPVAIPDAVCKDPYNPASHA